MRQLHKLRLASLLGLVAFSGLAVTDVSDANACGACFVPPAESTVVTDHRMVLAVSPQQTVLWDQIRYQGDPREFAWVLPVGRGASIEVGHDQFIAALDLTTQPVVNAPVRPRSFGDGDGNGCGCAAQEASLSSSRSAEAAPPPVTVIDSKVVGPYQSVTLRSENPRALNEWLETNGYNIPDAMDPVIAAYVAEKLDFIAIKLRPGVGVAAMQPVRVVVPGADAQLPLRMVAGGIGANVGLTLFVISEGRYEAQNYPNATVDANKVFWDFSTNRSNYQDLVQEGMKAQDGRTWVTEYANPTSVFRGAGLSSGSTSISLYDALYSTCVGSPDAVVPAKPLVEDAGTDTGAADAGHDSGTSSSDGGDQDGGDQDAGADAADAGQNPGIGDGEDNQGNPRPKDLPEAPAKPAGVQCGELDDLNVALKGLRSESVWVTRMRANLPAQALTADLRLTPNAEQAKVSHIYAARDPNPPGGSIASRRPGPTGSVLTGLMTLGAVAFLLRKRERKA